MQCPQPPPALRSHPTRSCVRLDRLLLRSYPTVKIRARFHVHPEQHLRVLRPAVLRALPDIKAGLTRVNPDAIRMIWDQVCFPRQPRNPEAVIGVRGEQCNKRWRWLGSVAHGRVQLIRGHESVLRIAKLPPELVADGSHLNGARWLAGVLHRMDHARG